MGGGRDGRMPRVCWEEEEGFTARAKGVLAHVEFQSSYGEGKLWHAMHKRRTRYHLINSTYRLCHPHSWGPRPSLLLEHTALGRMLPRL